MSAQGWLFSTEPPLCRAFRAYHAKNPHVFELFERFALEVAAKRTRYSSDAIVIRLRWFLDFETKDPAGFKLNDKWTSFYVRVFLWKHPRLKGFFELRQSIADELDLEAEPLEPDPCA